MDLSFGGPQDRVTGTTTDTEHEEDSPLSESFSPGLDTASVYSWRQEGIGLDVASSPGHSSII